MPDPSYRYTCARVGYGAIAGIHERKLRELGVGTAAVIEIDRGRREQAARHGHRVYASCAAAAEVDPDFWDVCAASGAHLAVLRAIIAVDPTANILLEKPICLHREIGALRAALAGFRGKLSINENYSSSRVTSAVRATAFDGLGLEPRRVVVEMSKNRVSDFELGRFIDYEAGALRYEGSHMLAILEDLGSDWVPQSISHVDCDDALVELQSGVVPLFGQGMADVVCSSRSGVPISLYTSMHGVIKYSYPPYGMDAIPKAAVGTRYRIVAVDGDDALGCRCSVVGFFEPVAGLPRGQGAVATLRDGKVVDIVQPIPDDTMRSHLARTLQYFGGQARNPCSADDAVRSVELLHAMFQERLRRMQTAIAGQCSGHGITVAEMMTLDDRLLGHILQWMIRRREVAATVEDIAAYTGQETFVVAPLLDRLEAKGLVVKTAAGGTAAYRLRLATAPRRVLPARIRQAIAGDDE